MQIPPTELYYLLYQTKPIIVSSWIYIVYFLLSLGMDERGGTTSWGTSGQPSPSYDSSRVSLLINP